MRQLMDARYPVYAEADITVESRDLPHEVIVGEIIVELAECPLLADPINAELSLVFPSPPGRGREAMPYGRGPHCRQLTAIEARP